MLLTVPWSLSIFFARCDLTTLGSAIDGKSTKFSWTQQGISVDTDTATNSKIMLLTSISYIIVQGIAFAYVYDPSGEAARKIETPFALAGFIVCAIFLVAYCVYQVFVPKLAEKRASKIEKDREEKINRLKAIAVITRFGSLDHMPSAQQQISEEKKKKLLH